MVNKFIIIIIMKQPYQNFKTSTSSLNQKVLKIEGHEFFYSWTLIPFFWTSGEVYSGFQSQSGQPYSYLTEVYV